MLLCYNHQIKTYIFQILVIFANMVKINKNMKEDNST
jgi:hypothetical protein